jgi:hypothetical protein
MPPLSPLFLRSLCHNERDGTRPYLSVPAPLERLSSPRERPQCDAGYSRTSVCPVPCRTMVPMLAWVAGLSLSVDDSHVDASLVVLMASAYFWWTACGLTPAQTAIRRPTVPRLA